MTAAAVTIPAVSTTMDPSTAPRPAHCALTFTMNSVIVKYSIPSRMRRSDASVVNANLPMLRTKLVSLDCQS